ncbi:MAG: peptidase M42 [Candidatus Cloacimonadota bacterium]|nr:MAG: peptidase M42 [Candidatus Cloacimonadota bacterium]
MDYQKYTEKSVNYIKELCEIPSPSGFTKKAEAWLMNKFQELGFNVYQSHKGSVIAEIGGEGNPLVFAAHIDTLGAMVRSVKSNGQIRITKVGGFSENFIETENAIIHTREGKEFTGTVQVIHPATHVYSDSGTMKRNDENVEVVLDEKTKSKSETEKLGISTGDFISFDPRFVYTQSGFLKSRHLDDKASAGLLVSLAEAVKKESIELSRKVYLVFTNYEEVGHGGAAGIPKDIKEMISVDMGCVGDDLEADEYKLSICAKDSRGPYDYDVTNALINIAKKEKLNFAVDVYPYYGSDADVTLAAGYDIKHGLIGPGVFASHGYERTHREGIENTLKLCLKYISKF